jgi:hypothetical protein
MYWCVTRWCQLSCPFWTFLPLLTNLVSSKVTILTEKFREHRYLQHTTQMKQYTVNCVDGDCNYVTLKVNSKLHHNIHLLKEGAVIELLECHPLYFHYEDRNDLRVCLLLSNFQVISHQNVPDNADTFIHDSYLPSLWEFVFSIRSINGDVSSRTLMSQKVPGFSQQSTTLTLTWKNVTKNTVLFDPNWGGIPGFPNTINGSELICCLFSILWPRVDTFGDS